MGNNPVSSGNHFTGNLTVARFVRNNKVPGPKGQDVDEQKERYDCYIGFFYHSVLLTVSFLKPCQILHDLFQVVLRLDNDILRIIYRSIFSGSNPVLKNRGPKGKNFFVVLRNITNTIPVGGNDIGGWFFAKQVYAE
jgi:hypothetical protein